MFWRFSASLVVCDSFASFLSLLRTLFALWVVRGFAYCDCVVFNMFVRLLCVVFNMSCGRIGGRRAGESRRRGGVAGREFVRLFGLLGERYEGCSSSYDAYPCSTRYSRCDRYNSLSRCGSVYRSYGG